MFLFFLGVGCFFLFSFLNQGEYNAGQFEGTFFLILLGYLCVFLSLITISLGIWNQRR
jgi:hypothetical protein